MISIILNCYDVNKAQRHSTMQCMADLRKFTDADFELIVVDNNQTHRLRDDYGVLQPFTLIENPENRNVYASYNQGAKIAKGDELFFIQNDVFVHERTIDKLSIYLKEYEMAFPQQVPVSRKDVLQINKLKDGEVAHIGQRDAGLLAIRREAFERAGGWDDRFHNLLGEAAFYSRCGDAGVDWIDRTNAFVSHIMAGNNLQKDDETYNTEMAHDAELLKEYL